MGGIEMMREEEIRCKICNKNKDQYDLFPARFDGREYICSNCLNSYPSTECAYPITLSAFAVFLPWIVLIFIAAFIRHTYF